MAQDLLGGFTEGRRRNMHGITNEEKPWLIALASIVTLDAVSTTILLNRPGYFEFHPYTAQATEKLGMVLGVLVSEFCQIIFAVTLVKGLCYLHRKVAAFVMLGIISQITLATVNNFARYFHCAWFPYNFIQKLLGY